MGASFRLACVPGAYCCSSHHCTSSQRSTLPLTVLGHPCITHTTLAGDTTPSFILSLAHLTAHGPRVFPRVCGIFSAAGGLALSSTSRHLISSAFLWQQSLAFPGGTCGDRRDDYFSSSGRLGTMSRPRSLHRFRLHWSGPLATDFCSARTDFRR